MTPECEKLQAFTDGELARAEAETFRAHLAGCDHCERGLLELMQLAALGAELAAPSGTQVATLPPRREAPIADLAARRRRIAYVAAPLLAAAAAFAVWIGTRGPSGGGAPGAHAPTLVALADERSFEPRVSWPAGDRFRPYDVPRAGGPAPREDISNKTLAALEDGGDPRGLIGAYLLRGDDRQAEAALATQGDTPDAHSDRAARALLQGHAEAALASADLALAAQPAHAQAQWNRALALRDLGLPLSAAAAFDAVAARGEPGWSEEAKSRAGKLREQGKSAAESWQRADRAGKALVANGTPVPDDDVAAHAATIPMYFYHALRSAPSAERAQALAGLAAALDARFGGTVLSESVKRVAAADFSVRAPLAAAYAEIELRQRENRVDRGAATKLLLATTRAPRTAAAGDLRLGVLLLSSLGAERPAELASAARESGDPWFEIMPERTAALHLRDTGDPNGADRALRQVLARCRVEFRCMQLERDFALTQVEWFYRPLDARKHLVIGLELARRLGEWSYEGRMLQELGQASSILGHHSLARAYLGEQGRRTAFNPNERARCFEQRFVQVLLTTTEIGQLRFDAALQELRRAPRCEDLPDLQDILVVADLARFGITEAEAAQATADLAALRGAYGDSAGLLAATDYVQGRLLAARDRAAAEPFLRKTIERAAAAPADDVIADVVQAYAYRALISLAAGAGELGAALDLFAAAEALKAPSRCAVGVMYDDDQVIVAARGADGQAIGKVRRRLVPDEDPRSVVPEDVVNALRPCERVDVIAFAPLSGRLVLPPDLAWSFVSAGGATLAGATPPRRVIVADTEPPAELGLPRLRAWSGAAEGTTVRVMGAAATPSRVLAEMATASDIEIHAHGLVNSASADTSVLALSPDADGKYTLSAQDLSGVQLRGRPLVVLAACETTETAAYLHEAWNLPVAFVTAGASAVLASGAPIPDADAGVFFAGVRARVVAGAPIAQAVRDERVAWLARDSHGWTEHVMVFEGIRPDHQGGAR